MSSMFGPGTFGSPVGLNLGPSPSIGTGSSPLPPLDQERSPPPTPNPNDQLASAQPDGSSQGPSQSQSQSQAQLALSAAARIRAISPPTPAPSPQPFGNRIRFLSTEDDDLVDPARQDEQRVVSLIRAQFGHLSAGAKLSVLSLLLADSPPSTLSPLLPLITPRLKRDFLRTLPLELSFHVLSFVDDVRTLARASGVSRFWRALLEDEGTWKRMCWKSGFGDAAEGTKQRQIGERMRQMEFGERMEEEGTPAGRERRGTLDRIRLAELAANLQPAQQPSTEPSRNTGWQAATLQSDATQTGASTWESSTGLGLGSSFAVEPVASTSTLAERRLRNSTRASSNPSSSAAALSLLTSPPRPLPFMQTRASEFDEAAVSPTTRLPAGDEINSPLQASIGSAAAGLGIPDLSDRAASLDLASPTRPGPSRLFNLGSTQAGTSVPLRSPSYSNPIPTWPDPVSEPKPFSYKTHFKRAYLTESAWLRGPGRLLSTQMSTDDGVVTSLGFDNEWIVVGMATSKVHVFEAESGSYVKTLDGHELGVWCLTLVSSGGGPLSPDQQPTSPVRTRNQPGLGLGSAPGRSATNDRSFTTNSPASRSNTNLFRSTRGDDNPPEREGGTAYTRPKRRRSFHAFEASNGHRSDAEGPRTGGMGLGAGGETGDSSQQAGVCGTARGWGQKGAVVVSGGCDRDVRVWDIKSGTCKHVLRGHTSTVRCMRVIDGRPIAVSGSRDATLRVWNIETGQPMHLLSGHEHSVRCIEVSGNKVVSGSYDATCRVSNSCLHLLSFVELGLIQSVLWPSCGTSTLASACTCSEAMFTRSTLLRLTGYGSSRARSTRR